MVTKTLHGETSVGIASFKPRFNISSVVIQLSLLFHYSQQGCSVVKMHLPPLLNKQHKMSCFFLIQTYEMSKFLVMQLKFCSFETDGLYSVRRVDYYETWLRLRIVFVWNSILWKSYVAAYMLQHTLIFNVHPKVILKFRLMYISTAYTSQSLMAMLEFWT